MNTTSTKTTRRAKFAAAGARVRVYRAGQDLGVGRYVGSVRKSNGEWHQVNMAEPRKTPDVRTYRAANLTRV